MRRLFLLLCLSIWVAPCFGTITPVQSSNSPCISGAGTSCTVGFASNLTAGNFVVVGGSGATGLSSVSITGFTCSLGTASNGRSFICYAANFAGGVNSLTITVPASSFLDASAAEFSKIVAPSPADVTQANDTFASNTTWTTATVTTLTANDIVFYIGGTAVGNRTYTAGASGTIASQVQDATNLQSSFIWYRIVTTATGYTPSVSLNSAAAGTTLTMAFRASPNFITRRRMSVF